MGIIEISQELRTKRHAVTHAFFVTLEDQQEGYYVYCTVGETPSHFI